ncbi:MULTISPECIES: DUF1552 domain-containing protein [Vibrio]|uniref:DUF1552 domain-containing protein n=1 Tax=Vibrio TaxID=662 RepID=UPI00097E1C92|nr:MULTISPECIES: DUF1552 domain-containing protein [Vibrio]AQM21019.1 hypothetical protein PN51_14490 [Vibrio anguillarum]AUB86035.1 hypothetical protein CKY00_01615 [Vibrio anguillarum]AUB89472.1 hypothetical protein CKX99_01610 [Vibrio anguillarum]AUB92913.1 hypothetical protein CK210_01610 [Vibrio anguillarum]AUB96346.1 hypothetical protein CK209_01610 [Vibrio anguillarum]
MKENIQLTRRQLIKGSVALGVMAGLGLPSFNVHAGRSSTSPKFIFISFSDGYPRGTWHPTISGGQLAMNACTSPLENYKDYAVFIEGNKSQGGSGHDGYKGQMQEREGQGSLDYHCEQQYGSGMAKKALRLGVDTNYWGHGGFVATRSPNGALRATDSPHQVYNDLFAGESGSGESPQDVKKLRLLASSLEDVQILQTQLEQVAASKLQTMDSVGASLQEELQSSGIVTGECPTYIYDQLNQGNGRDLTLNLQVANTILALACGKTRVVTLSLGTSNDSAQVASVSAMVPHDASHYGSSTIRETYIRHRQWYLSSVTKLIDQLKKIPDPEVGGSSLFDNTIIMISSEMDDGNAHSSNDLPAVLLGGQNTQLNTANGGRLVQNTTGNMGGVLRSFSDAYGLNAPYTNSPIPGLFK